MSTARGSGGGWDGGGRERVADRVRGREATGGALSVAGHFLANRLIFKYRLRTQLPTRVHTPIYPRHTHLSTPGGNSVMRRPFDMANSANTEMGINLLGGGDLAGSRIYFSNFNNANEIGQKNRGNVTLP